MICQDDIFIVNFTELEITDRSLFRKSLELRFDASLYYYHQSTDDNCTISKLSSTAHFSTVPASVRFTLNHVFRASRNDSDLILLVVQVWALDDENFGGPILRPVAWTFAKLSLACNEIAFAPLMEAHNESENGLVQKIKRKLSRRASIFSASPLGALSATLVPDDMLPPRGVLCTCPFGNAKVPLIGDNGAPHLHVQVHSIAVARAKGLTIDLRTDADCTTRVSPFGFALKQTCGRSSPEHCTFEAVCALGDDPLGPTAELQLTLLCTDGTAMCSLPLLHARESSALVRNGKHELAFAHGGRKGKVVISTHLCSSVHSTAEPIAALLSGRAIDFATLVSCDSEALESALPNILPRLIAGIADVHANAFEAFVGVLTKVLARITFIADANEDAEQLDCGAILRTSVVLAVSANRAAATLGLVTQWRKFINASNRDAWCGVASFIVATIAQNCPEHLSDELVRSLFSLMLELARQYLMRVSNSQKRTAQTFDTAIAALVQLLARAMTRHERVERPLMDALNDIALDSVELAAPLTHFMTMLDGAYALRPQVVDRCAPLLLRCCATVGVERDAWLPLTLLLWRRCTPQTRFARVDYCEIEQLCDMLVSALAERWRAQARELAVEASCVLALGVHARPCCESEFELAYKLLGGELSECETLAVLSNLQQFVTVHRAVVLDGARDDVFARKICERLLKLFASSHESVRVSATRTWRALLGATHTAGFALLAHMTTCMVSQVCEEHAATHMIAQLSTADAQAIAESTCVVALLKRAFEAARDAPSNLALKMLGAMHCSIELETACNDNRGSLLLESSHHLLHAPALRVQAIVALAKWHEGAARWTDAGFCHAFAAQLIAERVYNSTSLRPMLAHVVRGEPPQPPASSARDDRRPGTLHNIESHVSNAARCFVRSSALHLAIAVQSAAMDLFVQHRQFDAVNQLARSIVSLSSNGAIYMPIHTYCVERRGSGEWFVQETAIARDDFALARDNSRVYTVLPVEGDADDNSNDGCQFVCDQKPAKGADFSPRKTLTVQRSLLHAADHMPVMRCDERQMSVLEGDVAGIRSRIASVKRCIDAVKPDVKQLRQELQGILLTQVNDSPIELIRKHLSTQVAGGRPLLAAVADLVDVLRCALILNAQLLPANDEMTANLLEKALTELENEIARTNCKI